MKIEEVEGIVLSETNYSESSKILNIEIDLSKNKIFIDTNLDAADASIDIEE